MEKGITINAKLLAKRENIYTVYVFKNLDTSSYISCTKCPNWSTPVIDVGQEGFLTYKFIEAGKDSWYNKENGEYISYQYTANYFLDFIPIQEVTNKVVEKQQLIIG